VVRAAPFPQSRQDTEQRNDLERLGHVVQADEPADIGGNDSGPNADELDQKAGGVPFNSLRMRKSTRPDHSLQTQAILQRGLLWSGV
jgi:hypothetical protein